MNTLGSKSTDANPRLRNLPGMEGLKGLHVLLVEDEKMNSRLLKDLLERHGVHVKQAFDGREALEMMKEDGIDIALIDIHLGNDSLDGVEVLKTFKRMKPSSNLKTVALTAFALDSDREKFLKEGFDSYLSKPFPFSALLSLLEQLKE